LAFRSWVNGSSPVADHDPPLSLHRLWACVAPGHQSGRRAAGDVSWNTANNAVLTEGRRVSIEDPHRFDGVRVIGVDEHCRHQTSRGDKYIP
jgi:hypothetical protein